MKSGLLCVGHLTRRATYLDGASPPAMINDDAPVADALQSDRDVLHALALNEDELQRILAEKPERLRGLLHVVIKVTIFTNVELNNRQDSPAVEVISIVEQLSRTSAVSLLVSENVLSWLIQTTYSFDFASWDIELLCDLLLASAFLLSQPNLPPASLGISSTLPMLTPQLLYRGHTST